MAKELNRAQLHIHTNEGDSLASIESILLTAEKLDMKIIAITDHDRFNSAEKAKNLASQRNCSFAVMAGMEITASLSFDHILALFPAESPAFSQEKMFMGVEKTVDWVHEKGGVVILAHPLTSPFFWFHTEKCRIFDGLEILTPINGQRGENTWVNQRVNPFKREVTLIGGGDVHFINDPRWQYLTLFPGTTIVDLIEAIQKKQTIPSLANFNLPNPSMHDRLDQGLKALIEDPVKTGRILALAHSVNRYFKKTLNQ